MKNARRTAFALGLTLMALQANRGGAATTCEKQCDDNYKQCQQVCSQSNCIISCDSQLQYCLSGC
jgi:hypothetical protein